jgi:O-acetyl-ADP-ribose deacetylase (regulator of RNase III)
VTDRFPGLGFDPAPGDPDQARRCGREHARAAAELDELAAEVARLAEVSSFWRGAAASAFTALLSPLPGRLGSVASSCAAIAARLSAWAGELEELQAQARVLERAAGAALDRLRDAHAQSANLPATGAFVGGFPHVVDVAEAEQELRRLTARADEVHARWRAAGRRVAAAVDAATADAPALPRTLGELVWQHRVGLSGAANTASFLSLPALAIPVVGPAVSGGLSAVAFAAQTALAVHADASGTDVALGAIGVGFGGGAAAAGRMVTGPAGAPVVRGVQRGLEYAAIGTWAVGTARTVEAAGPRTAARPARGSATARPVPSPSPTLRQLLVAPVTGEPPRRTPAR